MIFGPRTFPFSFSKAEGMLCRDLSVGKVARHTGGEISAEVGFSGTSSVPRLDLGTSRKIPREARDDARYGRKTAATSAMA
jgi:hypothetical protein